MASITEKVMAKVEKVAAKKLAQAEKKASMRLTALKSACKSLTALEYLENGKTLIVAYKERKIGVLNGGGPQACTVTSDGKVAYVKLTSAEFAEWAKAMMEKIDKAE